MELTELTYFTYWTALGAQWRSPLSDYYFRIASQCGGKAYALADGGRLCAYAILTDENRGAVLSYLFTDHALRRKGLASRLVQELAAAAEGYLRIHIVQTHPFFEAVYRTAARAGFRMNDVSRVYSYPLGDWLRQRADRMMLPRMRSLLLRDGSSCLPLDSVSADTLRQLAESAKNAFANSLDPAPFFRSGAAGLDTQVSAALTGPDGSLRAYTLVTRAAADTVCFEQIAEAKAEIGSGSVVAPLCRSLEAIIARPELRRMVLTVSEGNTRSLALVRQCMEGQEHSTLRNYSLILFPPQSGAPGVPAEER